MQARVGRGRGAAGLMRYLLDEGIKATGLKRPEIIGGTLAGTGAAELTRELTAVRELRPDIKKHLWHTSLALPDGEKLTPQQWQAVAQDFMQEMGFPEDTAWTAIRHSDTEHDHIHIVACRISLSGGVWHGQWEVPRAIEATQLLEKKHGLTITKGLYDDEHKRRPSDRAKKRPSPREINRAIRKGEGVPRLRLQSLVESAAKGQPTAVEFAEKLELSGVNVRANLASTGRMNGFSFEIDGVAMKGSDLGKAFTWKGLQAQGVSYEQDRDGAGLERFSSRAAVTSSPSDPAATAEHDRASVPAGAPGGADGKQYQDGIAAAGAGAPADRPDAAGVEQPAAVPGERVEPADRAADEPARPGTAGADELRPGNGGAAADAGRADPTPAAAVESAADRDRQSNQPATGPSAADRQATGGAEPANTTTEGGAGGAGGGTGNQQPAVEQPGANGAPELVETGSGGSSSGSRGRPAGNDWASRFRQASAAKRNAKRGADDARVVEQVDRAGTRVDPRHRQSARAVDPTPYLQSVGYRVKREGRHLSVYQGKDEAYRVTRKPDGHWVACDHYGNGVGDNIALVQEIERNAGFAEAVYKLTGAPSVDITNKSHVDRNNKANVDRQKPRLPIMAPTDREAGRLYLRDRGISADTIAAAEQAGMVRYTRGAVLFVGTDASGAVQNVTRRAIDPADEVQKRDLRGSDKGFPPVLPGNPADVWVVEGGADALAVHDLYRRADAPVPTVIVSSGANVLSWADNPDLQPVLQGAGRVIVAEEHEKDEEARERADTGHRRQREALEALGCKVASWQPPEGYKDLAEFNERRGDVEQRKQMERAQRAAMRQERGKSRGRGPTLG